MRLLQHAERAAMARTALDHIDRRVGNEAQQLGRLRSHILRARMTGHVHADAFGQGFMPPGSPCLLGDVDDIFVDVVGRRRPAA